MFKTGSRTLFSNLNFTKKIQPPCYTTGIVTKRDGFLFRRKGIDFIAEKYNQRFTVIVEIGSFSLVLPGSKDPHYPYSIETQRRNGGREREREKGVAIFHGELEKFWSQITPLFHSMLAPPPRLYWILKR